MPLPDRTPGWTFPRGRCSPTCPSHTRVRHHYYLLLRVRSAAPPANGRRRSGTITRTQLRSATLRLLLWCFETYGAIGDDALDLISNLNTEIMSHFADTGDQRPYILQRLGVALQLGNALVMREGLMSSRRRTAVYGSGSGG